MEQSETPVSESCVRSPSSEGLHRQTGQIQALTSKKGLGDTWSQATALALEFSASPPVNFIVLRDTSGISKALITGLSHNCLSSNRPPP